MRNDRSWIKVLFIVYVKMKAPFLYLPTLDVNVCTLAIVFPVLIWNCNFIEQTGIDQANNRCFWKSLSCPRRTPHKRKSMDIHSLYRRAAINNYLWKKISAHLCALEYSRLHSICHESKIHNLIKIKHSALYLFSRGKHLTFCSYLGHLLCESIYKRFSDPQM